MAEAPVERRLAAILAADVFGYSRLMGTDEEGTLAALKAHRARTDCWLKGHLALELIVRGVRLGRNIDDFTDRTMKHELSPSALRSRYVLAPPRCGIWSHIRQNGYCGQCLDGVTRLVR